MSTLSDAEYVKIVEEAFEEAWQILHDEEGWKEEKKSDEGDMVYSKKNKKGKKMYKITVTLDIPADKLIQALENCNDISSWNKTLSKHEILKRIPNTNVIISYQVTTPAGPGDIVAARDFIFIYKNEKRGTEWLQGGRSIEYPPAPKVSKIVRAWNNPGGTYIKQSSDPNKCEFTWLMDCEFRGWLPASVLEMANPMAQIQFVDFVRKWVKTL